VDQELDRGRRLTVAAGPIQKYIMHSRQFGNELENIFNFKYNFRWTSHKIFQRHYRQNTISK